MKLVEKVQSEALRRGLIEAHSKDLVPPELHELWEESGGVLKIHERLRILELGIPAQNS